MIESRLPYLLTVQQRHRLEALQRINHKVRDLLAHVRMGGATHIDTSEKLDAEVNKLINFIDVNNPQTIPTHDKTGKKPQA